MSHLEELIKLGFLVEESSKESIEKLDEKRFQELVKHLKDEKPFIVSKDLINSILAREIEILKQFKPIEEFTVQDFVGVLNKRYSFLQSILLGKVELKNIVSINKVSSGNVSVIGLVKDILIKNGKRDIVLEDPTGYIEALVDAKLTEKLVLDDVVAVTGRITGKFLYAEKIFFPSVPLRPVNYSKDNVRVAFTDKNVDADYIIRKDKIEDRMKRKNYSISTPCMLKINEVVMLVAPGFDAMEMINKRYINIDNIDFLIDPVPDIIFTDKKVNMSYKGISILSKENVIDLKTRKVEPVQQ
jgi:hypothetical protein